MIGNAIMKVSNPDISCAAVAKTSKPNLLTNKISNNTLKILTPIASGPAISNINILRCIELQKYAVKIAIVIAA
jgi:hypothetical protein